MAKILWNTFRTEHKDNIKLPMFYILPLKSKLSQSIIKKAQRKTIDKNLKKIPTRYGMFVEWAKKNLQDDWASDHKTGFIQVTTEHDEKLIHSEFKIGLSISSKYSNRFCEIDFHNFDEFAEKMGYKP